MEDAEAEVSHLIAEAAGMGYTPVPAARGATARRGVVPYRDESPRGPAARTLAIIIGALFFAALLNADHLVDRAGKKPFGGSRDFWLAVWQPYQDVSDATYLNRPRLWVDNLLGRELTARPIDLPAPPPPLATAAPSAPTTVPVEAGTASVTAPPTVTATATVAPATPVTPAPRLRTPTADAPLKLWVGGDSMSREFGGSLGRLASASRLLAPTLDSETSSGLTRPDFFDWPKHLAEVAQKQQPDVMVIMFGANDAQGIRTPDGKVFQPLSDGWRAEYRRRVAGTMDLVGGPHRLVIWMGQPIMETDGFSARMADIDAIYREEAAKREGFVYFDSWALFVDAAGKYNAFLPDANGALQNMRASDGIHLTMAGADRLASGVMRSLKEQAPALP